MDRKLKLLLKLSVNLSQEKDLSEILKKLNEITKDLLEADRCSIFLHDKKTNELWTIVAHGVKEIRIKDDKGIAGLVFKEQKRIEIEDAYEDPRFNKEVDKRTGYRTKSILATPMIDKKGKTIGVFQVINKLGAPKFTPEDVELLNHMDMYASSVIENALLYQELKEAHQDVIYRLANATEYKDPETKNHIIRVGLYSYEIAKKLGLPKRRCELLKLATQMHDIGKVGIPDRVLKKPDKLNDVEWEIMKKHTVYGYSILKGSESEVLKIAANTAQDHHEKWNGKGYPEGKKGKEITLEGRITAIVDVFDALMSKRPYKDPWPLEKTLDIIKEESGEHFDPGIVEIFFEILDKIMEIKDKYEG
ncbi:MAG: HD domain-containing phosphohydrolase [Fusobacteriota bacterium]